jgi:hypothetical protein
MPNCNVFADKGVGLFGSVPIGNQYANFHWREPKNAVHDLRSFQFSKNHSHSEVTLSRRFEIVLSKKFGLRTDCCLRQTWPDLRASRIQSFER